MDVDFDSAKDAVNREKHGFSLADAADFDFDSALILEDMRRDYGERRYRAIGMLNGRVVVVAFTLRGKTLRPISLRRANKKERANYESQIF